MKPSGWSGRGGRGRGGVYSTTGFIPNDVGSPGADVASLNRFLAQSDGEIARALKDPFLGLTQQDFMTDAYEINKPGIKDAAQRFVKESQDRQYSKAYLIGLTQEFVQETTGRTLTDSEAERVFNREYGSRAKAILAAAKIGNVRLTDAQYRRLEQSARGQFLKLAYSKTERGSLESTKRRRIGGENEAVARRLREDMLRNFS